MKASLLALFTLALAGCASVPTAPPESVAIPETDTPAARSEVVSAVVSAVATPEAGPETAPDPGTAETCPLHAPCSNGWALPDAAAGAVGGTPEPEWVPGGHQPLACTVEFPAVGAMKTRPNLQLMWEHYLHLPPPGVWREVGGQVEVNGCLNYRDGGWQNACTVRLSHMLNAGGLRIPRMAGKTVTGGNGENYMFRLDDAREFLLRRLGPADLDLRSGLAWADDLPPRPGIVIMSFPRGGGATGHATVWNGAGTVDGSGVGGLRVMFWELPCFLPPGRQPAS